MKTWTVISIATCLFCIVLCSCEAEYEVRQDVSLERMNQPEIDSWIEQVELYLAKTKEYALWLDEAIHTLGTMAEMDFQVLSEYQVVVMMEQEEEYSVSEEYLQSILDQFREKYSQMRYHLFLTENQEKIDTFCEGTWVDELKPVVEVDLSFQSGVSANNATRNALKGQLLSVIEKLKTIIVLECFSQIGARLLEQGSAYLEDLETQTHFHQGHILKEINMDYMIKALDALLVMRKKAASLYDFLLSFCTNADSLS